MNTAPIGILLVDDHAIVREGYRALFARQPGLRVLAEAGDGATAYQLFKDQHPDVVITDISLPGSSGLELISRIKQRAPKARILVFSMHQNPGIVLTAIRAGALGYVTKSSPPEVLLRAISDVQAGRHALSADIAQALAIEQLRGEQLALDALTVREFEILMLLLDGKGAGTIASTLNISPKTVCNCHYLIKRKLGVGSDIELVRLAIKLNVMDLLQLAAAP
ncbi:response regulator [Methylotetracoccus oryzae]|uniref:response regulator n=1 Tax=Methylotetracoccus oryzae TaxID=1919059 RepID=UPI00111904BC|nr:response regulator transcription factor [Methylotetracoccus oryzae]